MPFPVGSLKFKARRRTLGASAHRVVVRRQLPWYWYALGATLALFLLIALLFAIQRPGGEEQKELDFLRRQVRELNDELLGLRSTAGTEKNAVQIERSTTQQLVARVKVLESENAALKEDLLLFERLLQAAGGDAAVRIEELRVLPDAPHQFRYKVLLAYQSGKPPQEFRGRLQLMVVFLLEGKLKELIVYAGKEGAGGHDVVIRGLLRKEGRFELPPGATLQSVEARVFQGDTLITRRHERL